MTMGKELSFENIKPVEKFNTATATKEELIAYIKKLEGQLENMNDAIVFMIRKDKERNYNPTGVWVGNAFNEHHCNRCGHSALWEEEPDGYYEVQSRFCPNCGADMRGGAE